MNLAMFIFTPFRGFCLFILFGVFFYSEKFKVFYGILESRVFRYLGKISYEVYLWHMPVYFTVLTITGDSVQRLIALPITFNYLGSGLPIAR